jgi:serine/threonine protein kinase
MTEKDYVDGRFELIKQVASGGMGSVHRAIDHHTGQTTAVKFMLTDDERASARFQREAATLARIHHPAVVGYIAHGATTDGRLYLAMEWLDGYDLQERLHRARTNATVATVDERTGRRSLLAPSEIMAVARIAASALDAPATAWSTATSSRPIYSCPMVKWIACAWSTSGRRDGRRLAWALRRPA